MKMFLEKWYIRIYQIVIRDQGIVHLKHMQNFRSKKQYVWNSLNIRRKFWPFKPQSHKMVKHTQTIRRQIANELFECVWPFRGIGAWRVKSDDH